MTIHRLTRHVLLIHHQRGKSHSSSFLYPGPSKSKTARFQQISIMENQPSSKTKTNIVATTYPVMKFELLPHRDKIVEEWVCDQNGIRHLVVKSNHNFETYYASQKTCSTESEWQECLAAMRAQLPQGFRIDLHRTSTSAQLIKLLKELTYNEDKNVNLPNSQNNINFKSKSWCPKHSIWQLSSLSRWQLKESAHTNNASSQKCLNFMYHENELGNISRQELVSQIPEILLDVQSHHKVLDMCASPGSKTKQVLSLLHDPKSTNDTIPEGIIIANECDPSRCDRLGVNLNKQSSPCLITVNQDAQTFPDIFLFDDTRKDKLCMKYDRIVCDVPCSGDGTIRKNPQIWEDWTPGSGNSRPHLQYNIVERGAELLELGGLMAYSSCAINPIENEAVLGRLLLAANGSLELIDIKGELPGLNWAPGHTHWQVSDSQMNYYERYEDVPDILKQSSIRKSMFSHNYSENLHLDRSIRLLPHHNDCGGFFVAIIKKTRLLPWENGLVTEDNWNDFDLSSRVRNKIKGTSEKYEKNKDKKRRKNVMIDSRPKPVRALTHHPAFYSFLESKEPEMQNVFRFYNLPRNENFIDTSLMFTAYGKRSQVYVTNSRIKNILEANVIGDHRNTRLNVFYAGSKVLTKESKTTSSIKHKSNSDIT